MGDAPPRTGADGERRGALRAPARRPHLLLALYLAAAYLGLVWPGYPALANRFEPQVLGLPFVFAYVVAWALSAPLALGAYMAATERRT